MKAVLVSQQNPTYDDLPGVRYHFPRRYLKTAHAAVNDSIIYYEPGRIPGQSRSGKMSYFGVARLTSVNEDHARPDHFYAHLQDYLPFSYPVPFRAGGELLESSISSREHK
jgi:putative restriction endonuclease